MVAVSGPNKTGLPCAERLEEVLAASIDDGRKAVADEGERGQGVDAGKVAHRVQYEMANGMGGGYLRLANRLQSCDPHRFHQLARAGDVTRRDNQAKRRKLRLHPRVRVQDFGLLLRAARAARDENGRIGRKLQNGAHPRSLVRGATWAISCIEFGVTDDLNALRSLSSSKSLDSAASASDWTSIRSILDNIQRNRPELKRRTRR